jgi:hypothetical protein
MTRSDGTEIDALLLLLLLLLLFYCRQIWLFDRASLMLPAASLEAEELGFQASGYR